VTSTSLSSSSKSIKFFFSSAAIVSLISSGISGKSLTGLIFPFTVIVLFLKYAVISVSYPICLLKI
jgi:hypothetical protein